MPESSSLQNASARRQNPAFRAMGLPKLRAKLPSRNWTIFLTVVGSFTAAVTYDRRQKKRAQQKWCNIVSHLSDEAMPGSFLPRKLMIYLSAPPGDGLRAAREHFQEYVKPILVAAAVDWEIVEGRKEGDVRMKLAENIRKSRRSSGEVSAEEPKLDILLEIREKFGVRQDPVAGDIVIGRHTWKEYVRGLHEGWLGPIDAPWEAVVGDTEAVQASNTTETEAPARDPESSSVRDFAAPEHDLSTINNGDKDKFESDTDNRHLARENSHGEAEITEVKANTKRAPIINKPYNWPREYETSPSPPSIPNHFSPSVVVPFPHLLGFLNTPIRVYRFLNKRFLADEIGQEIASILVSQEEDITYRAPTVSPTLPGISSIEVDSGSWEQQELLLAEEKDWHKSARKPYEPGEEDADRPWLEPMVIDERIGLRMTKPELVGNPSSIGKHSENTSSTKLFDDGSQIRGKNREWKGGADSFERKSWSMWLKQAVGLDKEEPKCKGWEHGIVGQEDT